MTRTLRYRLPAPPMVFVGRDAELAWLTAAFTRAPTVLITGQSGLGKTALAVRAALGLDRERVVYCRLAPGERLAPALCQALGAPADTLEAALAAAEAEGCHVIADDLNREDAAEVRAALTAIAAHARKSRWLCLSRVDPLLDASDVPTLRLAGLSDEQLASLARAYAPALPADDAAALARIAAGVPGALWTALERKLVSARPWTEQDLATLPDAAERLLRALDVFSVPVPPAVAAELCPLPDEAVLEALDHQGLLERRDGLLRLSDAARTAIPSQTVSAETLARAARRLIAERDAELRLDGLRLLLLSGRAVEAVGHAEKFLGELLAGGHGRALWQLLREVAGDAAARLRLTCAVSTAEPQALAAATLPEAATDEDRLSWARALYLRGELVRAVEVSRGIPTFEAGLLEARALAARGGAHVTTAVARLESLAPPDRSSAARRDAHLAVILSHADQPERALALAAGVQRVLAELPLTERADAARCVAGVISRFGRVADAEKLVASALEGVDAHSVVATELFHLASGLAIKRCAYRRAGELLGRLKPLGEGTRLRHQVAVVDGARAVAMGEYAGVEERLVECALSAAEDGMASAYGALAGLVFHARAKAAVPLSAVRPSDYDEIPGNTLAELLRLRRRVRLMGPQGISPPPIDATHSVERRAVSHLVTAELELLSGALDSALSHVMQAIETARRFDHTNWEITARVLQCEALLIGDQRDKAAHAVQELQALVEPLGSRQLDQEARFLAMAAGSLPPAPGLLEELAESIATAPVASRRARLLLGGVARADLLDQQLIAVLARRPGWSNLGSIRAEAATEGTWQTGWGLDELRQQVWFPSGRTLDFTRWPVLWTLLRALADRPDGASKEYLVGAVWAEIEYHPLRHDNRLHAAVRKLRHVIEDDPQQPRRVLTTPTGYRLGGLARRLRGT